MDNYYGDLADILGSSVGLVMGTSPSSGELPQVTTTDMWQMSHSKIVSPMDDFGNPFCTLIKDPLFEDLDNIPIFTGSSNIFTGSSNIIQESATTFPDDDKYSNVIQISSKLLSSSDTSFCSNSSRLPKPLAPNHELICNDLVNHMMVSGNSSSSRSSSCFIENRRVQISSPQYTGIKRRKGLQKKVVCIPAPAPVNSRPTGEIVPSDLWAWRKYGQKPIKGSPHPRGYYRCSSSKGCSARKQVERSRIDPNMLVITYTSEHNHPWPTQRNALAGSTRNQSSKNSITSAAKNSSSNEPRESPSPSLKEEHKEVSSNIVTANIISKNVKDEEKDTEIEDVDGFVGAESYRPALFDSVNHDPDKDLFAELGEIEADPLELMFTQGFTGEECESNKALDPYWYF
ncbi:WRKY domain-containing protein [Heracleum sosnowskyi]|uniref:WRKY domain-containing protein n=1 Tax=Heracleum sosnowskyi TaxID=360622 RepID=A0AAD8GYL0_9APIA|nr:WRKY domain-containing protein [Heracleum sosnowskyi]